jgi:hypothetical protein
MFGSALRYFLKHPARAGTVIASDPLGAWTIIEDAFAKRRERPAPPTLYHAEEDWEYRLHNSLGLPWPCPIVSEFWELWPEIIEELKLKGIRVGPKSFYSWNDGDAGFVRAIWCLTRHLCPRNLIETGVAHGVTSRFILEALKLNASGHLWSIDRPPLTTNCMTKSELQSATAFRHFGLMSGDRADDASLPSFSSSTRSIFLFTTACTASRTFALRWTALGLSYESAA